MMSEVVADLKPMPREDQDLDEVEGDSSRSEQHFELMSLCSSQPRWTRLHQYLHTEPSAMVHIQCLSYTPNISKAISMFQKSINKIQTTIQGWLQCTLISYHTTSADGVRRNDLNNRFPTTVSLIIHQEVYMSMIDYMKEGLLCREFSIIKQ